MHRTHDDDDDDDDDDDGISVDSSSVLNTTVSVPSPLGTANTNLSV